LVGCIPWSLELFLEMDFNLALHSAFFKILIIDEKGPHYHTSEASLEKIKNIMEREMYGTLDWLYMCLANKKLPSD
jgi:hypothetical protein